MKTEDFERLKKLCDENGFELVTESPNDNDKFFVVKKKDIWEGVEFVEHIVSGKIFKPMSIRSFIIDLNEEIGFKKTDCKPSTEQAYVEQLKKEAFERFGDIKVGDRFDSSCFYGDKTIPSEIDTCEFYYNKKHDLLFVGMVCLYDKGKWVERVKERISIRWEECDGNYIKFSYSGSVNLIPRMNELSALLEKYLNNEI